MNVRIHPTAIVDRHAELDHDIDVGPYSVIGPGVQMRKGCKLLSHVVIEGPSRIGESNTFHPFSVIGGAPQDKSYSGGPARLEIGDRNTFREHVTIHRGTDRGNEGQSTRIGNGNLFMVASHAAHDVTVGSNVILANAVQLAGHSVVEDFVNFGGMAGVAQFVRIGESAFVAAGAMCERDVPPFVVVQGDRARVRALNKVGLRRRNIDEVSISRLENAFRAVFFGKSSRAEALAKLESPDPLVQKFITALKSVQ